MNPDTLLKTETALNTSAPFRLHPKHPGDAAIVERLAPGVRKNIRLAAGVALDLDGRSSGVRILDRHGLEVEESTWRPIIRAARDAA